MSPFVIVELRLLHRREPVCVGPTASRDVERLGGASSPGEEAMGGLFFDFGQVRTESRHAAAALSRRLSDGRLDGVAATWPRDDAIFMILKFKQTLTQHRKT